MHKIVKLADIKHTAFKDEYNKKVSVMDEREEHIENTEKGIDRY